MPGTLPRPMPGMMPQLMSEAVLGEMPERARGRLRCVSALFLLSGVRGQGARRQRVAWQGHVVRADS
eukprot:2692927-Alexandrium_andersonii.AAC.1